MPRCTSFHRGGEDAYLSGVLPDSLFLSNEVDRYARATAPAVRAELFLRYPLRFVPIIINFFCESVAEHKFSNAGHAVAAVGFSACVVGEPCGGLVAGAAVAEGIFVLGQALFEEK
jgi:hypothetical protein